MLALVFMLVDHIHSYLQVLPSWTGLTTRFVAPLFVFFIVEGFFLTRNRRAYAIRLWVGALLMLAGNMLINYAFNNVDLMTGQMSVYSLLQGHNIFFTLALFFTMMQVFERISLSSGLQRGLWILALAPLFLLTLVAEGGIPMLPVFLIFFFLRGRIGTIYSAIAAWAGLLFASELYSYFSTEQVATLWQSLTFNNSFALVTVLVPLAFYNGQRGSNSAFAKWMFYVFYPLHLWVLMILSYLFIR